ncbi:hypothetical protein KEJ27_02925 [Candidatus Bathyarchaeota archaeon]|nr:hypothetical protein [Candidatus Bathyarchaeota archaeon]MBS7618607.1 hypothetical protein [Candidatus Bathyarchaeota archaeon]
MRIIEFIGGTPRLKALKHGFKRARKFFYPVWFLECALQAVEWLKEKQFILCLGFMKMNSPPRFAW